MEETPAAGAQALRFLAVFGYAALAVCVTGSGILALQQAIRRRHYRRMDVTGQFRMEIAVVVRALGFLGLRREEGETLQEFRARAVRGGTLQGAGARAEQGGTLRGTRVRVAQGNMLRNTIGHRVQAFAEGVSGDRHKETVGILCALQCISDYEEILYGEKAAEQEMLQTAVRERQELLAALRERKKWRYVLFWWMLTV